MMKNKERKHQKKNQKTQNGTESERGKARHMKNQVQLNDDCVIVVLCHGKEKEKKRKREKEKKRERKKERKKERL